MSNEPRYRVAKNRHNCPPWRDAIGIEDYEDGDTIVPAIVCWFTRGYGQKELADKVVQLLNESEQ